MRVAGERGRELPPQRLAGRGELLAGDVVAAFVLRRPDRVVYTDEAIELAQGRAPVREQLLLRDDENALAREPGEVRNESLVEAAAGEVLALRVGQRLLRRPVLRAVGAVVEVL